MDTTARSTTLTRIAAGATAVALAAGLAAIPSSSQAVITPRSTPADWRGRVVWVQPEKTLTAAGTRAALKHAEFGASDVRNGVDLYRIVYRTPDALGHRTTASGLLALPRTRATTLRVVSFAHGTIGYRPDAPSMLPDDLYASAPSIAYAGAGFASVAPDYVGLGLGPDRHPYFDMSSETSASVDMLRAARTVVRSHHRDLDRGVLATGFSQGASAALALGRALQHHTDPYFRLRALAPISGAYDFAGAELPALLAGKVAPPNGVAYTTYLFTAWKRLLHLYRDPHEVFRAPYAERAATLFNGNTPGSDMIQGLPATPDQLLTARGKAMLAHPTGRLASAVREIDSVCRWRPDAPVRLFHARDDEQVVQGNTSSCATSLRDRGVSVRTVDVGKPSYAHSRHLGTSIAGTAETLHWFRTLD